MTKFATIKPKAVAFAKKEKHKISSIVKIINEINPMKFVGVKVKFLSESDEKMVNSLKLLKYEATDDGESFNSITIFAELIDN